MRHLRLRASRGFEMMNKNVWFIPGITGRARCLDDVPKVQQPVLLHHPVVKRTASHVTFRHRQKIITSSSPNTLHDSSWSCPGPEKTTERISNATSKQATVRERLQHRYTGAAGIRSNSLDEHLALFRNSSWLSPFDLSNGPNPDGNLSDSSCSSPNEMTTVKLMPLLVIRKTSRHTISNDEVKIHASNTSVPLTRDSPLAIRLRNVLLRIESAKSLAC